MDNPSIRVILYVYFSVCHAEMNAFANKMSADVKNCSLYATLFPCNECAKIIIQSGIKQVYYLSDKKGEKYDAAREMFDIARVGYRYVMVYI